MKKKRALSFIISAAILLLTGTGTLSLCAEVPEGRSVVGGGYAVTEQTEDAGYTSVIYDASNGLPASDANCILSASDGYVWIGGYSGILRYDGSTFTRLPVSDGFTNGRGLFEDSKGRIWVGTNDNGVVVLDGNARTHLTYKDGMPSSSIRSFAEDTDGNVFIGTTEGICYADPNLWIHNMENESIGKERVLKLESDPSGRIYGQTKSGLIFAIEDREITRVYASEDLGEETVTTIKTDPVNPGKVYLGTDSNVVYYGNFGDRFDRMEKIDVSPLKGVHWISGDCGRIFVSSISMVGYLTEDHTVTGGQMAPTTLLGMKSTTTPSGRDPKLHGYPMHMCEILDQLSAPVYLERVSCNNPKNVMRAKAAIKKSFQAQLDGNGFSMVEIVTSCPTNWGMDALSALDFLEEKMFAEFPLGVIRDRT